MGGTQGIGFPTPSSGTSGQRPESRPKPRPNMRPSKPRTNPLHGRDVAPKRGAHHPFGEPRRPHPIPRPREDGGPRPRPREPMRRHEDEYTQKGKAFHTIENDQKV